jgi:hypothetical protein
MEVVLAILGAYMWVLFDHFKRSLCDNLSSGDLYWGSFRFVIAVPAAYALAAVFAPQIGRPLAFLIGALPTGTLMTAMWRFSASKLQLTDAPGKNQTTLHDPVRLTIRTGLGFGYVLGCTGEALVWVYFNDSLKIVRRFGLVGSHECRFLWEKLKDEDNVIQQKNAKAIVKALAREIKLPEEAVLGLLEQVAEDPYTKLQWKCWG